MRPAPVSILSQMNPAHAFPTDILKMHIDNLYLYVAISSRLSNRFTHTNSVCISVLSHKLRTPNASHVDFDTQNMFAESYKS
jgi:hypothetical protein